MINVDTAVPDEFIDITSTVPFDSHQEPREFLETLMNDDDIELPYTFLAKLINTLRRRDELLDTGRFSI